MEEKGSSSSSSSSTSRWNPTKDQIALLEALYKQGIRTPSSEQIQQITLKLREFGMTEGKNVFYWFQNHKARQRQKIKQERFAYYSRLLNNGMPMAQPVMAPPPPHGLNKNVMTGPYCLPAPQVGGVHGCYPPSYQNMLLPRPMQVSPTLPQAHQFPRVEPYHATSYGLNHNGTNVINASAHSFSLETLQLFPLHPTWILEAERSPSSLTSPSIEHPERVVVDDHGDGDSDGGDDEEEEVGEINNPPFFNFLG